MGMRWCAVQMLGVLAACGPSVDDADTGADTGTGSTGDAPSSSTGTPGTSASTDTGAPGTSGIGSSDTSGAIETSTSTSDPFDEGCGSYLDCPKGQACYDPGVYYENICVDAECVFDEDCPEGSRCNRFPHDSDAGECGPIPSASSSDSGDTDVSSSDDSGTSDDAAGSSESGSTGQAS